MSGMKVECYGCGGDCSNAYGTYRGYPYHFGCLPDAKGRAQALKKAFAEHGIPWPTDATGER